jgi:hypothetical protein
MDTPSRVLPVAPIGLRGLPRSGRPVRRSSFGAGVGIAAACGYVPMVAVVGGWFVRRRAVAVAASVAGIGVGTLVMSALAARLIDAVGWRGTYRIFGTAGPVLLLACTALVERPPGSGALTRSRMRDALASSVFRRLHLAALAFCLRARRAHRPAGRGRHHRRHRLVPGADPAGHRIRCRRLSPAARPSRHERSPPPRGRTGLTGAEALRASKQSRNGARAGARVGGRRDNPAVVPSRRQVLAWPALALVAAGCKSTACRPPAPAVATVAERIPPFLAAPDVNGAGLLAIAMGESGEPRWVPHLLDLLRVIGDEDGAVPIMVALQRITGELTVNDAAVAYAEHGSWMQRERPDPGEGYDVWKRTLYRRIDPTYDVLLAGTTDRLLLAEIQWGGVVRGGIPELNRPPRTIATADLEYLTPDELVFGVVHGGETVAYPERVLGYHELANDEVGGEALIVSYCPLCRSARAFVADGRSMETSGLVRLSNKLMVDRATGSLWQQTSGRAMTGTAAGASLRPVAMDSRTWSEWFDAHPDTAVVLRPDPADFPSTSYRYEPLDAYDHYDADPSPWFPVLRPPAGLRPKATVVTFASAGQALAVDTDALARAGPTVIAVDGGPVRAVLALPTASGARLYDATDAGLAPGPVAVAASDEASATLADGRRLAVLPSGRSAWFAFYGEHRDSAWWPR